jgi:hypothetical protein
MVSPVSSSSAALYATNATPAAPPPAPAKSNPPQDTVHLSQAAQSAAGDADHDGDSH